MPLIRHGRALRCMAAYPEQRREGILLKSPFQKRKSFNARQRLLAKALDIMQREPPSATWSLASSILVMPMAIFAVFPTAEQVGGKESGGRKWEIGRGGGRGGGGK